MFGSARLQACVYYILFSDLKEYCLFLIFVYSTPPAQNNKMIMKGSRLGEISYFRCPEN